MLIKLLLLIGVQIFPLLLGYRLKVVGHAQESWGRPLSRFVIIVMNTSVVLMAAWRLDIVWATMLKMLLIATLFGLLMTLVAVLMSNLHKQDRPSKGGYIVATTISNFGFTMAGFVCYLLYGQDGISIQTVYIYPLVLLIYLLWFPISRFYGTHNTGVGLVKSTLLAFTDVNSLPILGTMTGVILHAVGVGFPEFLGRYVLPFFIYAGTMLSMFTIGVTLQPKSVFRFMPQTISVSFSKFLTAPLIGLGLAWVLGIEGLNLAVILICSSVPVGLFSSFAASIFGLNRNLTNALFLLNTTLYLTVMLPILFWLLPRFVHAASALGTAP